MPSKPAKPKSKRVVKRPEGTTQLNINVPVELMGRLDEWIAKLNAAPAGARWSRTDVVRTLLVRALDAHADKGEAP